MRTRDDIHAEIEAVPEADLDELYEVIRRFAEARGGRREPGALARLRRIKIQGPADFASNLDHYLGGEEPLAPGTDVR
jgi:hypothetical protein